MPDQEAIQRGRCFEEYVAKVLGGVLQPGSGNKFYARSDVISGGLGISCKAESNLTWAKIYRNLLEAIELSYGTGNIPVLSLEDADKDEQLVVMRLSDFAKAFEDEVKLQTNDSSKGIEKRKNAEVPLMLR